LSIPQLTHDLQRGVLVLVLCYTDTVTRRSQRHAGGENEPEFPGDSPWDRNSPAADRSVPAVWFGWFLSLADRLARRRPAGGLEIRSRRVSLHVILLARVARPDQRDRWQQLRRWKRWDLWASPVRSGLLEGISLLPCFSVAASAAAWPRFAVAFSFNC
jgi:hypothetical protein